MVNKIEEEYNAEDRRLSKSLPEHDDDLVPSRIGFDGNYLNIVVGLHDELSEIKTTLMENSWLFDRMVVSIVGMTGIGKTTLPKQVYEDPLILSNFECCAWVTVGPKCQLKEILLSILAQTNPEIDKNQQASDKELAGYVKRSLKNKRYLIVLDDIWSTRVWSQLKNSFPENSLQSRVIQTTRLDEVASYGGNYAVTHRKRFLNKEESWHLFRAKVFGEDLYPHELEKVGRKIVDNCEGLPFAIIVVGEHLSRAEKTVEYWTMVAEKKINVFNGAEDEKVLNSSYKYLPEHLKAYFLYMGVFPRGYEISASKIINLWCAEGFHESNPPKTLEDIAMKCLEDLVSKNIVLVRQKSSSGKIKTCGIHYVFQHLCISEAEKNKFSYIINTYVNSSTEGMKRQRRMCVHNNVLFGFKDIYNSIETVSTTTRSLLCTGPYHQYPVPMCFGLRLLRVLDAFTIRFYKFPVKILKLVQLRYLAFKYNGDLPTSISKLWNLQYLIVCRDLSIKSYGAPSYLPTEIWNMKELRHLQVMGSALPDPCGALLPNLLTLLDTSIHSCTKEVIEGIPNLKKLGIQIELALDSVKFLCCFDHLSHLHGLEALKCVVLNPKPNPYVVAPPELARTLIIPLGFARITLKGFEDLWKYMRKIARSLNLGQFVSPPAPFSIFPIGLKKLTLTGFGYPWEYMSKIAKFPNLEVLKLQCYAFRGPNWEIKEGDFSKLKFLLLEDIDLEYLTANSECFPNLTRLIIRHCYKLKRIPLHFGPLTAFTVLEMFDCNPSTVAYFKQKTDSLRTYLLDVPRLHVHWSGDYGNIKS